MDLERTMVDYSRQREMDEDLRGQIRDSNHIIVGCGGIGYWVGILLGMMGAQQLILVDGDRVEATNLNRVPAPVKHTGKLKVNVLKAQLRILRPALRIVCIPANINADTFALMNDINNVVGGVVWDCTDDARIQQQLSAWCNEVGRSYVKIGYDGWKIGMYRQLASMWVVDDYQPGYTTSRANVLSSIIAAAMGILYYGRGNMNDVEIDLKGLVERASNQTTAQASEEAQGDDEDGDDEDDTL